MYKEQALDQLRMIINKAHDSRLRTTTLEYWRSSQPHNDIVVISVVYEQNKPVSVACARVVSGGITDNASLATLPTHRNKGYSKLALSLLIKQLRDNGIRYCANVAHDNAPSLAVMRHNQLDVVARERAMRSRGSYTVLTLSDTSEVD